MKWRALILFTCVLAALLVAFYFPFLALQRTFYLFDLSTIWQPMMTYIGSRLAQGELPLWNPYLLNGVPVLCYMYYPLNWLFAVLPFSNALSWILLIQQLVAGVGLFLLIMDFGWGRMTAAFAGIAIALSGMLFALQVHPPIQGAFCWFPLALWSLRRMSIGSGRQKLWLFALASTAIGLLALAGQPDVIVLPLAILVCFVVFAFISERKRGARRAWINAIVRTKAIACGVALAAPMLLLCAEWLAVSPRSAGLEVSQVLRWSASWYDLVSIVFPQPLGDLLRHNRFAAATWFDTEGGDVGSYFTSAYLGAVVCTLAIWGACDTSWRRRWLIVSLLLLAAIAALGVHTPLAEPVIRTFHLNSFRYPIKLLVWVDLCVVLLAARGFWMVVHRRPTRALTFTLIGWFVTLLVSLGLMITVSSAEQGTDLSLAAIAVVSKVIMASSIVGLAACLIFQAQLRQKIQSRIAAGSLLLFTTASLLLVACTFNFNPGPPDFYSDVPYLAARVRQLYPGLQLPRIFLDLPGMPTPNEIYAGHLFELYKFRRQYLLGCSNMPYGIGSMIEFTGQTADNRALWKMSVNGYGDGTDHGLATMCKLTGTRLFVSLLLAKWDGALHRLAPPKAPFFRELGIDEAMNLRLSAVDGAMPRVYMARNVKWGAPHAAVLEFISKGFDPTKLTILEHLRASDKGPLVSLSDADVDKSTCQIVLDKPERIKIDVTTGGDNFLVLSDQYYPGWKALVDGKPAEIVPANAIMRGVFVPAGTHQVEFVYRPWLLLAGQIIAAFALGSILLAILLSFIVPRDQQ